MFPLIFTPYFERYQPSIYVVLYYSISPPKQSLYISIHTNIAVRTHIPYAYCVCISDIYETFTFVTAMVRKRRQCVYLTVHLCIHSLLCYLKIYSKNNRCCFTALFFVLAFQRGLEINCSVLHYNCSLLVSCSVLYIIK